MKLEHAVSNVWNKYIECSKAVVKLLDFTITWNCALYKQRQSIQNEKKKALNSPLYCLLLFPGIHTKHIPKKSLSIMHPTKRKKPTLAYIYVSYIPYIVQHTKSNFRYLAKQHFRNLGMNRQKKNRFKRTKTSTRHNAIDSHSCSHSHAYSSLFFRLPVESLWCAHEKTVTLQSNETT